MALLRVLPLLQNKILAITEKAMEAPSLFLLLYIMPLFSNIGPPHQLLLEVLYERVFAVADDELAIGGFVNGDCGAIVATLVAPVNGYQIVAASAVDAYLNGGVVAYHYWAGA